MKIVNLRKETNEIQRVIALRNSRNHRYRYREFILEGRIAIDEAYRKGWKVKSLFYNKDQPLSKWAKHHIAEGKYEVAYEIDGALMDKIADKTESEELIAIAEVQIRPFSTYHPGPCDVVVVLDGPKSAGNVGMMIRSAVAFGANAIVISGHAADEFDPKCIRASVGTFFSIPIYRVEGIDSFAAKLQPLDATVIASGDEGAVSIGEADFGNGLLFLILGNETNGVSLGYREIARQFVRIPLPGTFTSLNIAAAGSIFLYEIFSRRKR